MPAYDSAEECHYRLKDTYVLYDGHAAYVMGEANVGGAGDRKIGVNLVVLPYKNEREAFVVSLDDPKLVYTWFPLGYLNTRHGAIYLQRFARRHRQQGINSTNIQTILDEGLSLELKHRGFSWNNDVLRTDALDRLVQNQYVPIDKALSMSKEYFDDNGRHKTFAIHRKFSVGVDSMGSDNLFYKTQPIARRHGQEKFILPEKYRHLIETLNEVGVPIQ